ncbi:MAG: hypothetical protein ABIG92_00740 [Candidatus Omnitrophota bacterium]
MILGIQDSTFINAQPMDALGIEARESKIKEASRIAIDLANKL